MSANLLDWGIQVVLWLQSGGDRWVGLMNGFTFTGNIEFYLLILPLIYWTMDRRLGVRVALFLLVSIVINNIGKMLLHSPRPYWYDAQVQLWSAPEFSFGLPSGHAQNAVIMWGLLALYGRRTWGWLVAIGLIFLTGLSRIYLGVHFPTDVLAGWLLGVLLLWLGVRWESAMAGWLQRYQLNQQVVILFAISLLLTALGVAVSRLVETTRMLPTAWSEAVVATTGVALTPFSLHDLVTATGALFGLSVGAFLCIQWGGFTTQVQRRRDYLFRSLIGIIGVLLLWRGLDVIFALLAAEESMLGYILRYLRYTAVGFWVAATAPMLFIRLGIAKPASGR